MSDLYADVIVNISHEKLDRPFQYRVPKELMGIIDTGMCVMVPFGMGNTMRKAYVIGFSDRPSIEVSRIKDIDSISTDTTAAQDIYLRLAAWMKKTYGSTYIAALKTVLPAAKKTKLLSHKYVYLKESVKEATEDFYEFGRKHQYARERLLGELLKFPDSKLPYELVTGKLNVSSAAVKAMADKGIIGTDSQEYYRNPVNISEKVIAEEKSLSDEQQAVIDGVIGDYDNGLRNTYLIHGITGSGKTEVYIKLIEEVVKRGRQAIVLIPEISLTYQTLMRFYSHFGDRVSVTNSTLTPGEKFDQMERARNGEIDVIIGPRSALFTPFPKTGIIIIDEEHEPAYKSETMPKYHARETAVELAKLVPGGAMVVLGSATPSLEAYYRAKTGEYRLFEMTKRLTGGTLPEVEVADLREELKSGNRSIFSRSLQEYITDRLEHKEQTMLFINRRGLAGFVSCRACGYVFKCPHCDVSLSEHRGGKLVCHYCGYEEPVRRTCPECGSKYVLAFRAGTEQIEKEVVRMWPKARVLRMDADTTARKGSYEKLITSFANQEADILVGTQMIVKGHDFPMVTLVGVLAADMSLYANDYRASERTFQLLTQAAGRAGRGERPGKVVIQTYQTDNYSIQYAAAQDYEGFYQEEISYRELLAYPPVAHMMAVQIQGQDEKRTMQFATRLRVLVENLRDSKLTIIGPAMASIGRINDIYRMVLYVKCEAMEDLTWAKDQLESFISRLNEEGRINDLSVQFDFDPINGY